MAEIIEVKGEDISLIKQIADLENVVLNKMIQEGKEGQLFTTGEEDILEYAKSDKNTVMVALDEEGKVEAAAYITQGQQPFTYNDITKYFKSGEKYKEYVKSQYPTKMQYNKALIDTYKIKISDQKRKFLILYFSTHSLISATILSTLLTLTFLPETGVAKQKKQ